MNKREKRKQSLLGLYYPCAYSSLKKYLEVWRDVLCEPSKSRSIEEWGYLEFDFTNHKKGIVYRELARSFAHGWLIKNNLTELARYMALHSNLATNANLKSRTGTIRQGIKRELVYFTKVRQYRKEHGGIIIMPQQGYQPTHSRSGAGTGVDQDW